MDAREVPSSFDESAYAAEEVVVDAFDLGADALGQRFDERTGEATIRARTRRALRTTFAKDGEARRGTLHRARRRRCEAIEPNVFCAARSVERALLPPDQAPTLRVILLFRVG